jgi:hypothetical protein
LYSTEFALPNVDDPASVEVGVILLGLDADRLLAGLGLTALADDPAMVTLVVDQARHNAARNLGADALLDLGISRWRVVRDRIAEVGPTASVALRQQWAQAMHAVERAKLGELGPASRAYLSACWLRRFDVDKHLESNRGLPPVPEG